MKYDYKKDDMFYDVESLTNVFTTAWWLPNKDVNAVILSYIDDDNIITSQSDYDYIKAYIYKKYPELELAKTQIVFEDITNAGLIKEFNTNDSNLGVLGMQSFAKRLGLANKLNSLNSRVDQRGEESGGLQYHPAYYPVKDTDPDFDENIHGFRFGYNSTNYDTTALAQFLGNLHDQYFRPDFAHRTICDDTGNTITAKDFRDFNDELFDDEWRSSMPMRLAHTDDRSKGFGDFDAPGWVLRKAWLNTGRFIDVARLNEKQQRVGLKRLLGVLGLRIMESDKLSINTRIANLEEFAELLAYNISDVVNLQTLFEHKVYQNSFNIRKQLIQTYPQVIYGQKRGYSEDGQDMPVDTGNYTNIRRDRLARDSTSAKFVEFALAPYSPITDFPVVSFIYPSKLEAEKLGIEQSDILEDTRAFFEANVTNDPEDQAHKDFMEIYNFYSSIKGLNYNSSDAYIKDYGENGILPKHLLPQDNKYMRKQMGKYNTNLFYHYKDANGIVHRTSCIANFSIGGIHGAEINMEKYKKDVRLNEIERNMQNYVESLYENALEAINGPVYIDVPTHLEIPDRIKKHITDENTIAIRRFMKSGSTKKKAIWREVPDVILFKKNASGNMAVDGKYAFVSVGKSNHEDFTSYYPLLISRLSIFINPKYHGYNEDGSPKDPYYEMFLNRMIKKKEAADKTLPATVRELAYIEQDSKKLLINAASGAGDATFKNNILANNAIISMRIIGQLFAWRIGQAQALAGARIPSTNTDGLYTIGISAEVNDRILEDIAKDMHIGIEPEVLDRFVSKDSNNRLEVCDGKITSARGGTLNSWNGPQPTQALDHAAIIDRILAQYLADPKIEDPTIKEFDEKRARKLFNDFIKENIQAGTPQKALLFFQWITASSTGTHRYIYAKDINKHTGEETIRNLQQYNRIFLIKENGTNVRTELHLATRRVVNKAKWDRQLKEYHNGDRKQSDLWEHHPDALNILLQNGLDIIAHNNDPSSKHYRDEASGQKVRGMPENQHVGIYNDSIVNLSNENAIEMIGFLDIDAYMLILKNTFKTWTNL